MARKLEAAKTPPKVVWVKPAALHVTIKFLGEVEPDEVERLKPLLAPPIAVAPFEIAWRGIGTFPNNHHPRALWLGVINGAAQLAAGNAELLEVVRDCRRLLNRRAMVAAVASEEPQMAPKPAQAPIDAMATQMRRNRPTIRLPKEVAPTAQFSPAIL